MNISIPFALYLADISFSISVFLVIIGFFMTPVLLFVTDEHGKTFFSIKTHFIMFLCSNLLFIAAILIPSKELIYQIIGYEAIKEVITSEKAVNTADKLYKIVDNKLDSMLERQKTK